MKFVKVMVKSSTKISVPFIKFSDRLLHIIKDIFRWGSKKCVGPWGGQLAAPELKLEQFNIILSILNLERCLGVLPTVWEEFLLFSSTTTFEHHLIRFKDGRVRSIDRGTGLELEYNIDRVDFFINN